MDAKQVGRVFGAEAKRRQGAGGLERDYQVGGIGDIQLSLGWAVINRGTILVDLNEDAQKLLSEAKKDVGKMNKYGKFSLMFDDRTLSVVVYQGQLVINGGALGKNVPDIEQAKAALEKLGFKER